MNCATFSENSIIRRIIINRILILHRLNVLYIEMHSVALKEICVKPYLGCECCKLNNKHFKTQGNQQFTNVLNSYMALTRFVLA
jgi:hypothetical protein